VNREDNPLLFFPKELDTASEIEIIENLAFNLKNLNALYPVPGVDECEKPIEEE
jgi:hypothetical protein